MCNNCIIRAECISESLGIITITLPDESLQNLCVGQYIRIGLFSSLPNTTRCARVQVTDGISTLEIMKCNQSWRPIQLLCRSVLNLQYLNDPELLVFKNANGRR